MGDKREELLRQLWTAQDEAYDLMCEYDSLPHHYGENILYQAEGHIPDRAQAEGEGLGGADPEPGQQSTVQPEAHGERAKGL